MVASTNMHGTRRQQKSLLGRASHLAIYIAIIVLALGGIGFVVGQHQAFASTTGSAPMTTYKSDSQRDGNASHETTLNTSNVNTATFGMVTSYPVDGLVYAQPLYVPGVSTNAGTHDLVFVATEHDSVYAFDADNQGPAVAPIWHTSFLVNGATPGVSAEVYANTPVLDIYPEVGITGTPVIDTATNSLYVVAMTKENGNYIERLHVLDISNGSEKSGSPVLITAAVAGTGSGAVNGQVPFDAKSANQRPGLLLMDGNVYMAFGGFGDAFPYHGWVLGYDAKTYQQTAVLNLTPNGSGAGIWMSGEGLVGDSTTNSIYLQTGNGTFTANTGGKDYGDSLVRISVPSLTVADYFTPFNQACLSANDRDLGSGGLAFLPAQSTNPQNLILGGGKEGRLYLLNRDNLGQYVVDANACTDTAMTTIDHTVQELPVNTVNGGIFSAPIYWNGNVYEIGTADKIKAFTLNNGMLSATATQTSPETFKYPGGNVVISSNGTTPGSAILWTIAPPASCSTTDHCNPSGGSTLRAYDATNLATELYSSSQNAARDTLSSYIKFSVPTVADGKVFVGTSNSVAIFGLISNTGTPTPSPTPVTNPYNNAGVSDDGANNFSNFDHNGASYSAQALAANGILPGQPFNVNNLQFTWPTPPSGSPNNYQASGQVLAVTPTSGATTLGLLGAATNGNASGSALITYTDGSTQTFSLSFSDWKLSNNTVGPVSGDEIAAVMPYANAGTSRSNIPNYIFYTAVTLKSGKTIKSVTLPTTVKTGQLHVFAIATGKGSPITAAQPPIPYNQIGISGDNTISSANFDGGGFSYSEQSLVAAGFTPGAQLTINGIHFTWPASKPGYPDEYYCLGQTLPVGSAKGATTLAFLGSSAQGIASGNAKITYTDGSTQTFTLSLSDWTLTASSVAPLANNHIAVSLPYRNVQTSRDLTTTYIFYTSVALKPGKTVKSVTLPTKTTTGLLHVFAVGVGTEKLAAPAFNNLGVGNDGNSVANFDNVGYSYSAQALQAAGISGGATITANGIAFPWPNVPVGAADNYVANGQVLPVKSTTGATTLAFLGAATNGTTTGTVTITYSDGSQQTIALVLSDWTLNGSSSQPAPGNTIVATMPYRDQGTAQSMTTTFLFYASVPLQAGKTIVSVTLPQDAKPGQLHVFAVGTGIEHLSAPVFNNAGISDDHVVSSANFDLVGYSYSAQALQAAGITPGASVSVNGFAFTWPNVVAGALDNYLANGQIVPITPGTNATALAFLGSATNGLSTGQISITYTDGTTQAVTITFSDWTLNGSSTAADPSNSIVATMPYRNQGTTRNGATTYLFATSVSLQTGKTVKTVTLPTTFTGGSMHIFSLATH